MSKSSPPTQGLSTQPPPRMQTEITFFFGAISQGPLSSSTSRESPPTCQTIERYNPVVLPRKVRSVRISSSELSRKELHETLCDNSAYDHEGFRSEAGKQTWSLLRCHFPNLLPWKWNEGITSTNLAFLWPPTCILARDITNKRVKCWVPWRCGFQSPGHHSLKHRDHTSPRHRLRLSAAWLVLLNSTLTKEVWNDWCENDGLGGNEKLEASHLCGNELCINPNHIHLERHKVNNDRKVCHHRKLDICLHQPACMVDKVMNRNEQEATLISQSEAIGKTFWACPFCTFSLNDRNPSPPEILRWKFVGQTLLDHIKSKHPAHWPF